MRAESGRQMLLPAPRKPQRLVDAPWLVISRTLRRQLGQLSTDARSANDAIVLTQTADRALFSVQGYLARMHALAEVASDPQLPDIKREGTEAKLLKHMTAIDRIAHTAAASGRHLLNGTFRGAFFPTENPLRSGLAVPGLPDLRTRVLSGVPYAEQLQRVEAGSLQALQPTEELTLTVEGKETVPLGTLAAAASETERLEQVQQAFHAQASVSGVALFVEPDPVAHKFAAWIRAECKDKESAQQLHLLSRHAYASGQVAAVQLTGLTADNSGISAEQVATADAWMEHFARGLRSISLATPAKAWVGALQLEQAQTQVTSARDRLAAGQQALRELADVKDVAPTVGHETAQATAHSTRAQLLAQVGQAMQAQANALPRQAMLLLR